MAIQDKTGEILLNSEDKEAMGIFTLELNEAQVELLKRILAVENGLWKEIYSPQNQIAMASLLDKLENNEVHN